MNKNYSEIEYFNPYLILGLSIISFGIYSLFWFYLKNKEFEEISNNSPQKSRCLIVLFLIPLISVILIAISNTIIKIILITINLILIEKYLLDFCIFFSKITKSNYEIYFLSLTISIIFLWLSIFNLIYFLGIIILLLTIMIMQNKLNILSDTIKFKKEKKSYYH